MIDQVPNVLACDVGNSGLRIARVTGEEVTDVQRFVHGQLGGLGSAVAKLWREMPDPKQLVAGSVCPAGLAALEAAASDVLDTKVLVVGRDLPLPIGTSLAEPEEIGVDRLCNASTAFNRLGVACIVADFGTAVTIDCVSAEGLFVGGAILPGLRMSAKALARQTALLPEVEPDEPSGPFGTDTTRAIQAGLVYGLRGALREIVEAGASELGQWPLVIATGGDAQRVAPLVGHGEMIQAIVPELTLMGVAMSYYRSLVG